VLTHNEIGKEIVVCVLCDLLRDVSAIEDGDGAILPTWTAVDSNNVRTSRELWEYMRNEGWHVEVSTALRAILMLKVTYISIIGRYVVVLGTEIELDSAYRFPPIVRLKYAFCDLSFPLVSLLKTKDNYVDAYLRVIKNADPLRTSVVFSCGMGAVRTTFAMTAACVVRRRQLILRGQPDPYAPKLPSSPLLSNSASGYNTVS